MVGVSKRGDEAIVGRAETDCFTSKKDRESSLAGVTGVAGPLLSMEEESLALLLPLLRKLRSMVEKSESLLDEIEPVEEPEALRMSGAVKACTFVVEINSVGSEMRLRLIVPGAYLTLVPRWGESGWSTLRLLRRVNARAKAMVDDMVQYLESTTRRTE